MRRASFLFSLALVTLASRHPFAQESSAAPSYGPPAPASASDVEALQKELHALEAARVEEAQKQADALAKLQRELDAERAARQADRLQAQADAEATREAIDRSTVIRAHNLGVSLSGYLQADVTAWNQASQDELSPTGDPINQTRFSIRRARLRAQVDYSVISGAIEFDGNTVNGYQARIIGVEASLVWRNPRRPMTPYLALTLGSFKTPFGFEIGQSDRVRLFLERSNSERAMFPGEYDLGARLMGGWRFLRYMVGAMNGDPIGEKLFPGRDPNQSKDLVGRVGVDMPILGRVEAAAGFSFDYGDGFHKGTPATKDTLVWRDLNQDGAVQFNEIQVIPGMASTPSANFERWAVGGDVEVTARLPHLGELMLYGELVYALNMDRATQVADPVAAGRDLRELGWYVAATQELTPWAQVGVRYDVYDPDRDANELRNGIYVPKDLTYTTWTVTGAVRYPGYARLQLEYQHNTNALGRGINGLPTSLAADSFMIRGQVQF